MLIILLAFELVAADDQSADASPRDEKMVQPDEDSRNPPSDEDVLSAFRRRRPSPDVIRPVGSSVNQGRESVLLVPEGFALIERNGRIRLEDPWWVFESRDSADRITSWKVLPNAVLEMMIRAASGQSEPLEFVLSGEFTVYEGENYLLCRVARREMTSARMPEKARERNSAEGKLLTSEEVAEALRTRRPREEFIVGASDRSNSVAGESPPAAARWPDGAPLINRSGRIMRDGAWWTFILESGENVLQERPMRLLPNLALEVMIRSSIDAVGGVVFLVSGEIMNFEGRNYLLPRVAIRRLDMGNFRK